MCSTQVLILGTECHYDIQPIMQKNSLENTKNIHTLNHALTEYSLFGKQQRNLLRKLKIW